MTVGYTVERYPVLSQTFVQNEIAELVRQGVDVVVARLWSGDEGLTSSVPVVDVREPHAGRRLLLRDHLHYAVRRPFGYLRFLWLARLLGDEARRVAWRRLPRAARELDRAGVDRLHAHFAWGGAALAMQLSALTGWPWAMTMHARDIFTDRRNLDRKLRDADLLITVCEFNRRYLRDELGVRRRVELVVCGVDVPLEPPGTQRDIDLLFIGRMVDKKGVDVLLHAFAVVARDRPAIHLHLVGDGPLLDAMSALAHELSITAQVTFHGSKAHSDTLSLLARTEVFCLPARVAADGDVDSMPLVIKEAMARSVAVVASDAGGINEMVDGATGLLVPPDDVPALAAALVRLLDDREFREKTAAAGYLRVVSDFTLTGEVATLHRLLNQLV